MKRNRGMSGGKATRSKAHPTTPSAGGAPAEASSPRKSPPPGSSVHEPRPPLPRGAIALLVSRTLDGDHKTAEESANLLREGDPHVLFELTRRFRARTWGDVRKTDRVAGRIARAATEGFQGRPEWPDAVDLVTRLFALQLSSFLIHFLRSTSLAEEALQDTWATLLKWGAESRIEPATLERWLYTVAKNAARDIQRKRRREPLLLDGTALIDQLESVEQPSTNERPLPVGEAMVRDLAKCLDELNAETRQVMDLFLAWSTDDQREDEKVTGRMIAPVLGITPNQSRNWLSRGKQQIRECMSAKGWHSRFQQPRRNPWTITS